MKKTLNTALCGLAAGIISYITSLIYYKISGDAAGSYPALLAAPMMLAIGLLVVLTGKLKLFAGASGYFLFEKPLSKSAGNLLGGMLASAVYRAVGSTAEPAGADGK